MSLLNMPVRPDDRAATDVPVPLGPTLLLRVARRVDLRLAGLLRRERETWAGADVDLAPPLDALEQSVLAGGKRLRPAFCFLGFLAAGGDDRSEQWAATVDDAGAAFELLHAFALVHDDVMDGAETRRGLPTPHARFAALHAQSGGRGASERFGESVAILVGDLAHVYAERLARTLPAAAQQVWHEMQVELMMGQYLDVHRTAHGRAGPAQARRIARLKSGGYTIERPLQLGAALVGASPAVQAELACYAEPLGLAFQFRDDVLGVVGDEQVMGKPAGSDLREGKPTALLALAFERADDRQRGVLERAGRPEVTDADVWDMQQVLIDTGALDSIEIEIEQLTEQAVTAILAADLPERAATALAELAWFAARRER